MISIKKRNILWLCIITFIYYCLSYGGTVKYILLIGITFLGIAHKKFFELFREEIWIVIPAFVYGIICILSIPFTSLKIFESMLKRFLLMIFPVVVGCIIFTLLKNKDIENFLNLQFLAITIVTFLTTTYTKENMLESQYAFIFGAYGIFYLYKQKYVLLMFSSIMLYLSHKRIADVAFLLSIIIVFFVYKFIDKRCYKYICSISMVVVLIASYIYIYTCKSGYIIDVFNRMGINSMGRANVWSKFNNSYEFSVMFLGRGGGWVDSALRELSIPSFDLLHNDLLTIYIELGFVGFGLVILAYCMIPILCKNQNCKIVIMSIIIYTLVNYMTDNISIYVNYWLPLTLIIEYLLTENYKSIRGD